MDTITLGEAANPAEIKKEQLLLWISVAALRLHSCKLQPKIKQFEKPKLLSDSVHFYALRCLNGPRFLDFLISLFTTVKVKYSHH